MPAIIKNDTVWVVVKKDGVMGEEWNRLIAELDHMCARYVNDIGKGLLVFTDPEAAEQYIKDTGRKDLEAIKVEGFLRFLPGWQEVLADLRCVILDSTYGAEDVEAKAVLVEDLIR